MPPRKTLFIFFAKLIVGYGLAIVPWPGLDRAYRAGFRAVGRTFFSEVGDSGRTIFKTEPYPGSKWTTVLILTNPKDRVAMQRNYDTRQGYLATALTLVLVWATPIPWSRRWKALLAAMLLIHLFLVLRLWLGLLDSFSEDKMAVITLGPFWKRAVRIVVVIFLTSMEATFFVPVFVWILVTFRRGDWQRLVTAGEAPALLNRGANSSKQRPPSHHPPKKHAPGDASKPK